MGDVAEAVAALTVDILTGRSSLDTELGESLVDVGASPFCALCSKSGGLMLPLRDISPAVVEVVLGDDGTLTGVRLLAPDLFVELPPFCFDDSASLLLLLAACCFKLASGGEFVLVGVDGTDMLPLFC